MLAEGIAGGFAGLYPELSNLETLGTARRGYFVEGLGGAQFALPAAIERLRGLRSDEPAGALVLAATDPANPTAPPCPGPRGRTTTPAAARRACRAPTWSRSTPSRSSTSSAAARPAARSGSRTRLAAAGLEALADAVRRGRVPRLGVERFDGEPVVGSPAGALIELGFRQGPRKLTLSA